VSDDLITQRKGELEQLFRADGAKLWRALYAFTGDADVASEARAEAFAQALAHRGEIKAPAAWIWTSSFRIARGLLKDRAATTAVSAEQVVQPVESVRDLVSALSELPERQRSVIVLHDYADRSADEVARTLGVTRATVYVHLSLGRKRLRGLLQETDDA
jgi:RNA polymerase sigma-70 factor, ECF subfamily